MGSARHARDAKLPRYSRRDDLRPPWPSLLSLSVSDCASLLPAARIAEIDHAIATHPVTLLGMAHMRLCTDAALQRLEGASACGHTISWTDASDPLWAYLQCKHPHEIVNGMQMHSYVYIGGSFVGNGFKLLPNAMGDADLAARLSAAGSTTCTRDCSGIAAASEIERLEEMKRQQLALLGCDARARAPTLRVLLASRPMARASSRRSGPRTRRRSTSTSSASTAASTTRSSSSAASSSATASRCRPTG